MLNNRSQKRFFFRNHGQSAVELAIFGSILMFVVAMIFRQGLNGGNFMNTQLKATRYALSKSYESALLVKPGRNSASVLIIEDRLGGDFTNKFGSRDRAPLIAGGSGTFSSQLFYPVDVGDCGDDAWKTAGISACDKEVLPHYDVWINGQRFPFLIANFKIHDLPVIQGTLAACGSSHPDDSRCWDNTATCSLPGGCLVLHRKVENYRGSEYDGNAGNNAFDPKFDGNPVPIGMRAAIPSGGTPMKFMWHWKEFVVEGEIPIDNSLDVDGDFYEEQIIDTDDSDADGRVDRVLVIDRQEGDMDFTIDGRRPTAQSGLLNDSQMFSFTQNGTAYRIEEGKLYVGRTDQYVRNVNVNDHVDVVQRTLQLSRNTGRFCNGAAPQASVDGRVNPVEACGGCFTGDNLQKTCLDPLTLKLYVRSRIENKGGRMWFTQTEKSP